jgi:hypothetical protein
MLGAKWTCCECGRTSYHLDGVQREECISYAHARCTGFPTYKAAQESSAKFCCRRCLTHNLPASPVLTLPGISRIATCASQLAPTYTGAYAPTSDSRTVTPPAQALAGATFCQPAVQSVVQGELDVQPAGCRATRPSPPPPVSPTPSALGALVEEVRQDDESFFLSHQEEIGLVEVRPDQSVPARPRGAPPDHPYSQSSQGPPDPS